MLVLRRRVVRISRCLVELVLKLDRERIDFRGIVPEDDGIVSREDFGFHAVQTCVRSCSVLALQITFSCTAALSMAFSWLSTVCPSVEFSTLSFSLYSYLA